MYVYFIFLIALYIIIPINNSAAGIITYFNIGQYAMKNPLKACQKVLTISIYLPPFFLNLLSSSGVSINPAK